MATDFDDIPGQPPRRRRGISFDPTINAGHVLTFAGMCFMLFTGWNLMDKRVVVLEEAKAYQQRRDDAQDATTVQRLGEIKEAIKEVKEGVNEIRKEQAQRGNRP